jgi:hypothetical protein
MGPEHFDEERETRQAFIDEVMAILEETLARQDLIRARLELIGQRLDAVTQQLARSREAAPTKDDSREG